MAAKDEAGPTEISRLEDARTMPQPSVVVADTGQKASFPISCINCRRRKIRCNKETPCSCCHRIGVACFYRHRAKRGTRAESERAAFGDKSSRKTDLMARLNDLEGVVRNLANRRQVKFLTDDSSPIQASSFGCTSAQSTTEPGEPSVAVDHRKPLRGEEPVMNQGRLVAVKGDHSSRYVSGDLSVTIMDEMGLFEKESKVLGSDESDPHSEPESGFAVNLDSDPNYRPTLDPRPKHCPVALPYCLTDVDLTGYHPQPFQISYLWSNYRETVEPFVKLIHVPSTEALLRDTRRAPGNISTSQEALLFSIYYASVAALQPKEVEELFRTNKQEVLGRYRYAIELAFAKKKIAQNCDLTVLQAFALFLHAFRCQDETMVCWSLTGLAIHLAKGIGLHRDGSYLDLDCFETEMRRRVWWQLLLLDLRTANQSGTDLVVRNHDFDTKMPTNIDDASISPETLELLDTKDEVTDSSVALVCCEIGRANRTLVEASSAADSPRSKAQSLGLADLYQREKVLLGLQQLVETRFITHFVIREANPLFKAAAMLARLLLAKTCLIVYQPILFNISVGKLADDARDRVYVAAIEIMEYCHALGEDASVEQYTWQIQTRPNWHAMCYFLLECCRRPWTSLVERGWQALQRYWELIGSREQLSQSPMMLSFRNLYLRCAEHRTTAKNHPKAGFETLQENLGKAETSVSSLEQRNMTTTESRVDYLMGPPNDADMFSFEQWAFPSTGNSSTEWWFDSSATTSNNHG